MPDIVEDTDLQSRMDQIIQTMKIIQGKGVNSLTDQELRDALGVTMSCVGFMAEAIKRHLRTGER